MIQDSSPITPPPELVEQWCHKWTDAQGKFGTYLATQAARWGADQELEACCEWLHSSLPGYDKHYADYLRDARRPKPPSLKEQALQALDLLKVDASTHGLGFDSSAIRRALESMPD